MILQVWAGNEACEPVTWRECKLVPRQVDFKVPKIECNGAEEIPYQDMEEVELEQMVTKMVCEVKHVTACNPVVSTKCANINYQECAELPEETCEEIEMQLPRQVSTSTFFILSRKNIRKNYLPTLIDIIDCTNFKRKYVVLYVLH